MRLAELSKNIPERIRTSNLRLRRPTLYPVELRGHHAQRLWAVARESVKDRQDARNREAADSPWRQLAPDGVVSRLTECPGTAKMKNRRDVRPLIADQGCFLGRELFVVV